ncbi:MAG: apolipoprotein A1/A4/E family protein [Phyllobacteriaceae bacterium]|nr:apolipoprotein A1/A4/E family protein [Phyllobacteriaceae bacterium]
MIETRRAELEVAAENLSRSISGVLENRTEGMVSILTGASQTLTDQFDTRLEGLESTLQSHGERLISEFETRTLAISEGTEKLNAALDARTRDINETLVNRTREIAQTFNEGSQSIGTLIDTGKQGLSEELQGFVFATSAMIDDNAQQLSARMAAVKTDLESRLGGDADRVEASDLGRQLRRRRRFESVGGAHAVAHAQVLRPVSGVVPRPAVAVREVHVVIPIGHIGWAEADPVAVVIVERLGDGHDRRHYWCSSFNWLGVVMVGLVPTIHPSACSGARG